MKNKVTLAISTFVLCSAVTTAEAAKHHSISKQSKHPATAHKTSHRSSDSHSKHHSRHTHHIVAHSHHSTDFASNYDPHSGMASLYSTRFQGRKTASGEKYDMFEMTAAHRTLPLRSYVEVTNLENNRKVVVRINDRGPFHGNRVLDLSTAAAEELGIAGGSEKVKITPLAMNDIVEDE
ncbi:MAG: septal ring lytic transglycosylase RlpA family protein [Methylococcales bacterium]|nr:septal ring lytic transglycosylase RlpA family protein [Methylococcales bacterium]MDP3009219.1 septal ring lytic transglycosylase RlpA family protein [Methylococcales bacterium]MDP3840016.1 septal ring lytic transglycosylase RlpA family protein [Methylococcales bacterium]